LLLYLTTIWKNLPLALDFKHVDLKKVLN
jgi:hypothetical protein